MCHPLRRELPEEDSRIGWAEWDRGHSGSINALQVAPNGWLLATASSDCTCKIWNILSYRKDVGLISQEMEVLIFA
jgi:WD40 repeat protein